MEMSDLDAPVLAPQEQDGFDSAGARWFWLRRSKIILPPLEQDGFGSAGARCLACSAIPHVRSTERNVEK
jgi:hypothetical protein